LLEYRKGNRRAESQYSEENRPNRVKCGRGFEKGTPGRVQLLVEKGKKKKKKTSLLQGTEKSTKGGKF